MRISDQFIDKVDWDIYDSVEIKCWERSRYILFATPLGWMENEVKEESDTNMYQCGVLPTPQTFKIKQLIVLPERGQDPKAIDIVWNNYIIKIWLMQKQMFGTTLLRFPTTQDLQVMWNPAKKEKGWYRARAITFSKFIDIPMQTHFSVILEGKNSIKHAPVRLKVVLSGELVRSMQ